MNYLAHAYLSFGVPGIVTGNMISDFIKGRKKFDYPPIVQKGITLHRMIDAFTDSHPATKEAKTVFKPYAGLYAGAFMDVAYDHFLATDGNEFTQQSLALFAQSVYKTLKQFETTVPDRFARMMPYMQQQDWLFNYSTITGMEKSFAGVVRRAAYLSSEHAIFKAFMDNYEFLKGFYAVFFPEVKAYTLNELNKLMDEE